MTRNTLGDLSNHLFMELERLNEDMAPEEMDAEIRRAKAVTGVAQQVIANANTMLRAIEYRDVSGDPSSVPRMLGNGD